MSEQRQFEYMELIQKHEKIIHKVIGLYVDVAEDRRDLYQEILLQAWRSFSNFKGNSAFSTWLYRVALNTVLTFNKKRKRALDDLPTPETTTTTNKDDSEVLHEVIKSLAEVDRMLISLHLDGYKNIEIADITGMTQNHINVKIHRIKALIIEKFKKLNTEI